MKKSIQFWVASGIALCCLAPTSPVPPQTLPPAIRIGATNAAEEAIKPLPIAPGIFTESNWYFVNKKSLLVSTCSAYGKSQFVITGRGGLPPTPREALGSEQPLADLGTTVQGQENHASVEEATNLTSSEPATIVEAQGWVTNAKGEVVLVAQAPTVTPYVPWLTPTTCHASLGTVSADSP